MARMRPPTTPRKALVVISPDLVKPGDPEKLSLARRAIELARHTACELEFFHVCHEAKIDRPSSAMDRDFQALRDEIVKAHAAALAEFVIRLNTGGLRIEHDVRWDKHREDAICQKCLESGADLVMKQAREHGYFLGPVQNTDWALLRKLPVPVWFVNQNHEPLEAIIGSVGTASGSGAQFQAVDHEVAQWAQMLGRQWNIAPRLIHIFEVPRLLMCLSTDPDVAEPMRVRHDHNEMFSKIQHENAASLLIVAVRNRGVWERLANPSNAGPVFASAECDALFLHDPRIAHARNPSASNSQDDAGFDLERAIASPTTAFRNPQAVLDSPMISDKLKLRILQSWRQEVHMIVTDRLGGLANSAYYLQRLEEINNALHAISSDTAGYATEAFRVRKHSPA